MFADAAPNLLNHISFIIALLSSSWYCFLVASGDYTKWSYPVLIGLTICKLTLVEKSTPLYQQNNENRDGNGSSPLCFNTLRQRLPNSCFGGLLHSAYTSLIHRVSNDIRQHNLNILSTTSILLPCMIFYILRVIRHLSERTRDGQYNHDELANDFGKLSAASLSFLLLPVSKHSALLSSLNLGDVEVVRIHIYAGTCAIVAGVAHGLYYTWIWFVLDGYSYGDIFPGGDCFQKGYSKQCYSQFVNLLGIMNGVGIVILGCTALWWVRRHYFNIFYYLHLALAIGLLFGLVMHYNKMVWYIAPSLLSYMASNVPVAFESMYKWRKGGVGITKVAFIPESRGCIELTIATNDSSEHRAIGKYVRLAVPEISSKSHPFTIFCDPHHPQDSKILVRPLGAFTTELSKRLESFLRAPELAASEITASTDSGQCPKMLINGVFTSSDLLGQAMKHDIIVVIAGGVGIVPYISLLWALYDVISGRPINEGETSHIQKPRRLHVHWISRDEGLIRYIMGNYFPLRRDTDDLETNPAITISVHHTNAQTSSIQSTSTPNDELDTFTQFMIPPERVSLLTSLYMGRNRSLLKNFLPASVIASICFGGLWIVNYCYENIQDKHVIETRSISVTGIFVWSVIISIGSQALVKMTDTLCQVVAYSKVERGAYDENGTIECGEISRDGLRRDNGIVIMTELMERSETEEESEYQQGLGASISHFHGRPNIDSIIKAEFEGARVEETDIGIFMCGPSSLTTAVSRAISNIENEGRPGGHCLANTSRHETRAYVYKERFEL